MILIMLTYFAFFLSFFTKIEFVRRNAIELKSAGLIWFMCVRAIVEVKDQSESAVGRNISEVDSIRQTERVLPAIISVFAVTNTWY